MPTIKFDTSKLLKSIGPFPLRAWKKAFFVCFIDFFLRSLQSKINKRNKECSFPRLYWKQALFCISVCNNILWVQISINKLIKPCFTSDAYAQSRFVSTTVAMLHFFHPNRWRGTNFFLLYSENIKTILSERPNIKRHKLQSLKRVNRNIEKRNSINN